MGIPQINFSWQSCHVNHLLKYLRMATLGCSVTRILLRIQWYRTLHFLVVESIRSSRPEVFCKKSVLRNFTKFTGKHLCQSLFIFSPKTCNYIKKETLAQVFTFEICEISKNTFITEHLWWLLLKYQRMLKHWRSLSKLFTIVQNLYPSEDKKIGY